MRSQNFRRGDFDLCAKVTCASKPATSRPSAHQKNDMNFMMPYGAGMIHPNVLKAGKIDPEEYSGYAWGFGVERLQMLLNNVSDRSLILLDEIGRGTSTYDGISIAWAITEFLHEHPTKAKTLFATHYHELNEMTTTFERIKNFNVSVKELKDTIIFLRKLVSGGSNHSFGIHVAKLAGMPSMVIHRANKILEKLEKNNKSKAVKEALKQTQEEEMQLSFFQLDDPLLENIKEEILATNIDTLTPIEALMKLNEIKRMLIKK